MKKGFVLILVLAIITMLTAGCSAFAEEASASGPEEEYVPKRIRLSESNRGPVKVEQKNGEVEYEALFSDGLLNKLEVELEDVDGAEYEVRFSAGGKIEYAEYETDDGEIYFDGSEWHNGNGEKVEGPDLSFIKKYFDGYRLKHPAYPHNTMGLVGLPLRELYPQLTRKWYHILPVDLTKEGVFRYPTVVSNMYYMGYCELTVQDGKVTVDYAVPLGNFTPEKQCMAWFTDIQEITPAFLDNPQSDYRYGKPVDIQTELKGQDTALLFMCNTVSYQIPLTDNFTFPAKFYSTSPSVQAVQRELRELLRKTESGAAE